LTARQMALIDNDGKCILEPGRFTVYLGGSQPDTRSEKLTGQKVLSTSFIVKGTPIEIEY
jgi:beta-glucosidase